MIFKRGQAFVKKREGILVKYQYNEGEDKHRKGVSSGSTAEEYGGS
ncbi:hypothetical protein C2W64_03498 [Brevibacillus laterosporus]|nr:hypothetical protein C2W64_03498 [Brevibacillus laterosporus]